MTYESREVGNNNDGGATVQVAGSDGTETGVAACE